MRLLFLLVLFSAWLPTFAQQNTFDLLVKNVRVVDVVRGITGQPCDIYFKEGKIASISAAKGKTKAAQRVIDGSGKYFMPGLTDMHVHFPAHDEERFFSLLTASGITSCRIMRSRKDAVPFVRSHTNGFPRMHIGYNFFGSDSLDINSIASMISSLKTQGYDFIKIFSLKDAAYFDPIMNAAKRNGLIICGHALSKIKAEKVIESGYRSIEHLGYFDRASPLRLDSLIDLAAKNKTFMCPTLDWSMMVYHSVPQDSLKRRAGFAIGQKLYQQDWDTSYAQTTHELADPKAQTLPDAMRNDVRHKIEILEKMRRAGVKVIAGSDAEEPFQTPGFSVIEELKLIQKAGFTNAELLQMVTVNPAAFFNTTVPVVKKGAPADFILLSADPLASIANLEKVAFVFKDQNVTDVQLLLNNLK